MPIFSAYELTQQKQQKTIYGNIYIQQQLYNLGIIPRIIRSNGSGIDNNGTLTNFTIGGVTLNNPTNPGYSATELLAINNVITSIVIAATPPTVPVIIPAGTGYSVLVYDSAGAAYTADSNLTTFTLVTATAAPPYTGINGSSIVRFVSDSIWLSKYGGVLYKTINNGLSWTQINNGTSWSFIVYIYSTDTTATIIYVGTVSRLYKTINGGSSWTELKYSAPAQGNGNFCINGDNIVWVGVYNDANSSSYSSTNGGATFSLTKLGFTTNFYGTDVIYFNGTFCSFMDDGTSTYKCISSDGVTWTKTAIATPFFFVAGTRRDPISGLIVIAVQTNGSESSSAIVYSTDDGNTWTPGTGSVVGKSARTTTSYPYRLVSIQNNIHYTGTLWIFIAYDGSVHKSSDGKVWTTAPTSPGANLLTTVGVAYNDSTNCIF
jgi:hypothetical protein